MHKEKRRQKSRWPIYLSLLVLGILILLYFIDPDVQQFIKEAWQVLKSGNEQKIFEWVQQFSWWGPLVIILAMILQMFLLVIPSVLLMVATVLAYGPYWGFGINLVAIFCASSVGYSIGYFIGTSIIDRLIGSESEKKISEFLKKYGFWAVIIARISPFLSNDAISFVAGILKMGYWKFIGATMLGITPLALLIAYLGENYERLKTGLIWIGIISLLVFIGYVWWDRRKK